MLATSSRSNAASMKALKDDIWQWEVRGYQNLETVEFG